MKIMKADAEGIKEAVRILKEGGVVAHPTDTCFGLAADVFNKEAVQKVAHIKKTSIQKPFSVLISGLDDLVRVARVTQEQMEFVYKYLPGPYTVIVPKNDHCNYQSFERTIGVRIPKHELSVEIVKKLGNPVTTTSANITGSDPAYSAREVEAIFAREKLQPDLILDTGAIPKNPPSRIVNLCGEEEVWLR